MQLDWGGVQKIEEVSLKWICVIRKDFHVLNLVPHSRLMSMRATGKFAEKLATGFLKEGLVDWRDGAESPRTWQSRTGRRWSNNYLIIRLVLKLSNSVIMQSDEELECLAEHFNLTPSHIVQPSRILLYIELIELIEPLCKRLCEGIFLFSREMPSPSTRIPKCPPSIPP